MTRETILPVANPQVIFKPVADGAVLLHSGSEVYFGLNQVGARIWELLPPVSRSLDDLCAAIGQHYPQVELEQIRADVLAILIELASHELVIAARSNGDSEA
jgi:hypothetical protein